MTYELAASTWGSEEIEAIQRVIASNRYTMGENVRLLEEEFAAYHGVRYGVMVNSGSSANLVGVAALFHKKERALKRGDEVLVPAISWATTYHPLQQYGLKLKFVDVDLDTLNVSPGQLAEAVGPKTRMIMAVSILGNPAALDVMGRLCDRHGLYLFEDNCESMDAELGNRKTGTFGEINTFSFFFSHHISTMEGGMILTNDEEIADLCKSIRAHGWTRDLPTPSPLFERRNSDHFEAYRFILPGYNVRPLEMSGAIGREQLKKLPRFTAGRRENLALFQRLFCGDERFIVPRENGKSSSFSFPIVLNPSLKIDRERVFAALHNADIRFRIITGGNFLRHDVIQYFDYQIHRGATPNADAAHDNGFFVGNHPFNLSGEIEHLHHVLSKAC